MALAHALMSSLLVDGPCSGYDMVKRFDECISCFWLASHPQIYKELRSMEQQGWVGCETVMQVGRPNKYVYQITETGTAELAAWIGVPSQPTTIREDLMIKILAGHLVPKSTLLAELKQRRDTHYANVISLKEKIEQEVPEPRSYAATLHYLTLRRGIRYETDWVDWCDEAMALIAATPESQDTAVADAAAVALGNLDVAMVTATV
jgi:DNA-binding PadR family transcriptional regulator